MIKDSVTDGLKEKISFRKHAHPFFPELKKQTKEYFENENLSKSGNLYLHLKGFFFFALFIGCYTTIVFLNISLWLALPISALMGFAAAGIGFNLMHDGAHGGFSEKKWLNVIAAYSINLLGGDANLWKNKHNIIHHTYTNIEGHDQDIAQMPVFRLNHLQKQSFFHKYQHIYCFLVYGFSSVLWVFLLDYIKYFTGKVGSIKMLKFNTRDHLIFWVTKIAYLIVYLALPAYFNGWKYTLLTFFVFHFILGLTLSLVFQLAHVVETTVFILPAESGKMDEEWALHQLKTTSNFATQNSFITWYTGGLNYQVEHHLFPNISHSHYPSLNKIVKQLCKEFDVTYNEFPTFSAAVASHLKHLKETGYADK